MRTLKQLEGVWQLWQSQVCTTCLRHLSGTTWIRLEWRMYKWIWTIRSKISVSAEKFGAAWCVRQKENGAKWKDIRSGFAKFNKNSLAILSFSPKSSGQAQAIPMQMWRRHTTTSCPMAFHRTGAKRKSKNVVEMAFLCKSFARINDVLTCVPFSILELRIVDIFLHSEWWRRGLVLRSFRFLADETVLTLGLQDRCLRTKRRQADRKFQDKTWQNKIISPLKLQHLSKYK